MFKKILALLALGVACIAPATGGTLQPVACVPYTIPVQSTVTACGNGMQGAKYKTTTKSCPSGTITTSTDYDTSGCVAPPQVSGNVNTPTRCALTPDACGASPTAAGCPSGYHWTLAGSNVAHCVSDDPVCGWGTSLKHDSLGNPSCVANTCPSNQVLQADGQSCACQANMVWNGGTCVAALPSCVESSQAVNAAACGTGFTGTTYQVQTTTCPAGPYGTPTTSTSGYDRSNCVAVAPTCSSSSSTESTVCGDPAQYTGAMYRSVTTSCPSGPSGAPSTSYGSWDTTGCGCANGNLGYPNCTLFGGPPPPPPPAPKNSINCAGYKTHPGSGNTCVVYCVPGSCPDNSLGGPPLIGSCVPSGDGNGTQYCTYPLTW